MSNLELKGLKLLRALDNAFIDEKSPSPISITQLPIELLCSGQYQPRKKFDESILEELTNSIKAQGIIQPLIVRKIAEQRYEIIAGERRWRAAQKADLSYVPVIVREIDDSVALAFSLVENIQRENLNPIEEAVALNRFRHEFQMTHEEIAKMIGRSRVFVTNSLRLLALDVQVIDMLNEGKMDMGHARALLKLSPPEQYDLACLVSEKQLNVRETEALASRWKHSTEKTSKKKALTRPHKQSAEWSAYLSLQLATPVVVNVDETGQGKITISLSSTKVIADLIALLPKNG